MGLAFLSGANPFLFFLEEKTVSLRGKRSPSDGRLLFFLEEKKQKKIICGTVTSLHSCLFHQPVAQNGRFVCEPSVFRSWQNVRESVFSQKNILPRSVFCFFSSRKENVPFLFFLERKENKRKSSADHAFALFKAVYAILLHKTDGSYVNRPFFVPGRMCGKASFLRLIVYPAVSFVSFLQEKKSYPFKKRNRTL